MRIFCGTEDSEVMVRVVEGDLRNPFAGLSMRGDAKQFGSPRAVPSVLAVEPICDGAEVNESVVVPDAIDVVNLLRWPFAGHVKPSDSMPEKHFPINHELHIPCGMGRIADTLPDRDSASLDKVGKQSGFWIVMKQFAQTLRGKIGLSHETLRELIGQRPASVTSTALALSF